MKNISSVTILLLGGLLGGSQTVLGQGAVVFNPDNGHYYEVVPEGTDWALANSAAADMSYQDFPGHLATVSSPQENDFIYTAVYSSAFTDDPGFTGKGAWVWLGGYQPPGSAEPGGGWIWVTGEAFDYANWDAGQPSNSEGVPQDYLVMWHDGVWNDAAGPQFGGFTPQGFIVEFEPVPEPGLISLLVISGLTVALTSRGRRKRAFA